MSASDFHLLTSDDWSDYQLLDSGDLRKLERFGKVRVNRPDPQAFWKPATPVADWKADANFASAKDEDDDRGNWTFTGKQPPEDWPIAWNGLKLNARLAAFRHMGVFPEHSVHWRWAMDQVASANRPIRALNLFGYTGIMSLALAKAGADVVHLDASPKSIAQARENAALSGLDAAPIRWITDDAMKFVERELRRGSKYDVIVLDPPKFGRGPKNETWRFATTRSSSSRQSTPSASPTPPWRKPSPAPCPAARSSAARWPSAKPPPATSSCQQACSRAGRHDAFPALRETPT
jgi:23S rRNA (cytosine1962-C5)-methyltransferase